MSEAPTELDELSVQLLVALAQDLSADGVSLPRLGKQLGQGVSVLLRRLSLMGDATLGGHAGRGWVQVRHTGERWVARLTDTGREFVSQHLTSALPPPAQPGEPARAPHREHP